MMLTPSLMLLTVRRGWGADFCSKNINTNAHSMPSRSPKSWRANSMVLRHIRSRIIAHAGQGFASSSRIVLQVTTNKNVIHDSAELSNIGGLGWAGIYKNLSIAPSLLSLLHSDPYYKSKEVFKCFLSLSKLYKRVKTSCKLDNKNCKLSKPFNAYQSK